MAVNQDVLGLVSDQASDDLTAITNQDTQVTANITDWTNLDTLYLAMMSKAQTELEDRLLGVKIPVAIPAWAPSTAYTGAVLLPVPIPGDYVRPIVYNSTLKLVYECTIGGVSGLAEPVWPLIVGNTVTEGTGVEWTCRDASDLFETGSTYSVTTLSDWALVDAPGGTPVYAYTNTLTTIWTPGGAETDPAVTGLGTAATTRISVTPSANVNWMRLRIKTGVQSVTLRSVYIGTRDGVTQDILAGTGHQITFNGGQSEALVNTATILDSDWMSISLVSGTEYFVSIYFEGLVIHQFGLGSQYWRNGDYASTEAWGVSGTSRTNRWFAQFIEGWDTSASPIWDGDALVGQWVTDWSKIYPLVYSFPFGTKSMLRALGKGATIIASRKTQITNRNPLLVNYKTYDIEALAGTGGTIAPTGTVTIDRGKSQTFTFTPGGGYSIDKILVDGVDVGSAVSHTFTNVTVDHTIKVFFV